MIKYHIYDSHICICVCTTSACIGQTYDQVDNYMLQVALPVGLKLLKKWYVISQSGDIC